MKHIERSGLYQGMHQWLRASTALLVFASCASPVDDEISEVEQLLKPSPGGGIGIDEACPTWGCGTNSPSIDFAGFHELNELGLENLEGFRITRLQKRNASNQWISYRPDVRNGYLYARSLTTGADIYSGSQLVGARFIVTKPAEHRTFHLTIEFHSEAPIWAMQVAQTPTYRIAWSEPSTGLRGYVCSDPIAEGGLQPHDAVLMDDDRVDADMLEFTGLPPTNWFSIGCARHALTKVHQLGYTKAANAILGVTTSLAQRTAALKMITADYCGSGDAFTIQGQPLHWRDRNGWNDTTIPGEKVEAAWSERGALCVGTPRLIANPPVPPASFPDLTAELAAFGCTLPPTCTPEIIGAAGIDYDNAHFVSTNY